MFGGRDWMLLGIDCEYSRAVWEGRVGFVLAAFQWFPRYFEAGRRG